jgi:thymidylate synthase (FAD)
MEGCFMTIINTPFPVLDKGHVTLIDLLPHPLTGITPDMAVVNAARVSFNGASKGEDADKRLLMRLYKDRHTSPFEMVVFQWRIKAPVLVWWQWVRHRMASYSAQSGRYVEFTEDEFYVPDEWRAQSQSNKQGSDGLIDFDDAQDLTVRLRSHYMNSFDLYQLALDRGVAREQARLFLPGWASYYTFMVKMDAHNALNFFKLRMAQDAQWEIRQYANVMYEQTFKPLMPWTAEAFETYTLPAPIVRMSNRDA